MNKDRSAVLIAGLIAAGAVIIVVSKRMYAPSPRPPIEAPAPPVVLATPPSPSPKPSPLPTALPTVPPQAAAMKMQEQMFRKLAMPIPGQKPAVGQINPSQILQSEASAKAALKDLETCMARANDPTAGMPAGTAGAQQLPAQLKEMMKTGMQTGCLSAGQQIVAKYPSLKSEFESRLVSKASPQALEALKRNGPAGAMPPMPQMPPFPPPSGH